MDTSGASTRAPSTTRCMVFCDGFGRMYHWLEPPKQMFHIVIGLVLNRWKMEWLT